MAIVVATFVVGSTLVNTAHATEAQVKPREARLANAAQHDGRLQARFESLVARWKRETMTPSSDFMLFVEHPAYKEIIDMGWDAVPLILAEFAREPDHWGWALEQITRQDPVPVEAAGDAEAIGQAWLAWGRSNKLIA